MGVSEEKAVGERDESRGEEKGVGVGRGGGGETRLSFLSCSPFPLRLVCAGVPGHGCCCDS